MIALTLIAGLTLRNAPLAISCIVGQYIAMIWYSLSYIPYARSVLSLIKDNKIYHNFQEFDFLMYMEILLTFLRVFFS